MTKSRLEAFSDGVLAIIITIMVLELKVPHEASWEALWQLRYTALSYLMSFLFVGIYWGNHHHLLHTVHHVNSRIIWGNMVLLFTLSIIPFSTAWMGENHFDKVPVSFYSVNLIACAIGFTILQKVIESHYTHSTNLIQALHRQERKGWITMGLYILSLLSAFIYPTVSLVIYAVVTVMWIVPDKRIEEALLEKQQSLT
jgi:uncharacterized membrane protein